MVRRIRRRRIIRQRFIVSEGMGSFITGSKLKAERETIRLIKKGKKPRLELITPRIQRARTLLIKRKGGI